MSTPEDIPEDRFESYLCDKCGRGSIKQIDGEWLCDYCGESYGESE